MEYIDILDENGEMTGEVKSRDEVHEKGLWHKAAHIWFVNSKGEILLQLRSKTKKTHPGDWDISSAGHISAGETPLQGAVREIKEELGLYMLESEIVPLGQIKKSSILNNGTYFNNQFDCVYLVKKDVLISDIKFNDGEVEKVEWVPIEEFKKWVKEGKSDLVPHPEEYELLFKSI